MKNPTVRLLIILLHFTYLCSMEEQNNVVLFAIPGQNRLGSEEGYIKNILNLDARMPNIPIVKIPTPSCAPDLGQYFCQRHLINALENEKNGLNRDIIIHATSQGTATILNTLKHSYPKIIAVILEAVLMSGDSAIWHNAIDFIGPNIKHMPFMYYIAPCIVACSSYFPAGQQPIWSINHETFPQNIPFIIMHSKNDPCLPFDGACALYYKLAEKNTQVYFIQKEDTSHIDLLYSLHSYHEPVRTILNKHCNLNLTGPKELSSDMKMELQPDRESFRDVYEKLYNQEKKSWWIHNTIMAGILLIILYKKFYATLLIGNQS